MMRATFIFFMIVSSYASNLSLQRCRSARLNLFTDDPPFDGSSVEVRFSHDYNVTELRETIQILNETGHLISYHLCIEQEERMKANDKRIKEEIEQREQEWKRKVIDAHVVERCEKEKKAIEEKNQNKWFWQFAKTLPVREVCPCMRLEEELFHPCVEAACLKAGSSTRMCEFLGLAGAGEPVFRCTNTIKIRVV